MSVDLASVLPVTNEEYDGVLALRSALRSGLDLEVYPRQVVYASAEGDELSFVHGLPGTSGLGPVTYAQDKRMQRGLMERYGIPVPKAATFTMGRGVRAAKQFAARIGYPVLVKPAVGDNGIETFRGIKSASGLLNALDYLRIPPNERAGFSRAAYGLTELREPGEENGRLVVPPGYMFMVEKQLEGHYVHFLVSDGAVRSVIDCQGVPSDGSLAGGTEVIDTVHPSLKAMALDAVAAIPGLGVAAVAITVPDLTKPADGQEVGVVEFSERPSLWVQAKVDPALAERLGEDIVRRYAQGRGHELREPQESVSVEFEAHALPDAAEGGEAIVTAARHAGLDAQLSDVDLTEGTVYGRVSGDPGIIARLANAMLEGAIEEQRVMLVVVRRIDAPSSSST